MSWVIGLHASAYYEDKIRFCLFHELDSNSMYITPEIDIAMEQVRDKMLELVGCCLVLRSQKGYHFFSASMLDWHKWKEYQYILHQIYPVKYFGDVLRITDKPNEHRMDKFVSFSQLMTDYTYSSIHWQIIHMYCRHAGIMEFPANKVLVTTTDFRKYKAWNH